MNRGPALRFQHLLLLGEDRPDPFLSAQPCDLVLPGDDPASGQLVGDEDEGMGGGGEGE